MGDISADSIDFASRKIRIVELYSLAKEPIGKKVKLPIGKAALRVSIGNTIEHPKDIKHHKPHTKGDHKLQAALKPKKYVDLVRNGIFSDEGGIARKTNEGHNDTNAKSLDDGENNRRERKDRKDYLIAPCEHRSQFVKCLKRALGFLLHQVSFVNL